VKISRKVLGGATFLTHTVDITKLYLRTKVNRHAGRCDCRHYPCRIRGWYKGYDV